MGLFSFKKKENPLSGLHFQAEECVGLPILLF
jgi:hypothetical protein